MKAILQSVRPQWCEKICHQIGTKNGKPVYEKTLEVRKTAPKIPTPFKCYIYETLGKKVWTDIPIPKAQGGGDIRELVQIGGKVIGEYVCDECSLLSHSHYGYIQKHGCISKSELLKYMRIPENRDLQYSDGCWGWHISNLQIYDRPKELGEFKQCDKCPYGDKARCDEHEFSCDGSYALYSAPQSWCYVEAQR